MLKLHLKYKSEKARQMKEKMVASRVKKVHPLSTWVLFTEALDLHRHCGAIILGVIHNHTEVMCISLNTITIISSLRYNDKNDEAWSRNNTACRHRCGGIAMKPHDIIIIKTCCPELQQPR
jgi:hypothetical protein